MCIFLPQMKVPQPKRGRPKQEENPNKPKIRGTMENGEEILLTDNELNELSLKDMQEEYEPDMASEEWDKLYNAWKLLRNRRNVQKNREAKPQKIIDLTAKVREQERDISRLERKVRNLEKKRGADEIDRLNQEMDAWKKR